MKEQSAAGSAVLASMSVLMWALWSALTQVFLATDMTEREGSRQTAYEIWLAAFVAVMVAAWLGEVLLAYLLVRYAGRGRPARGRKLAVWVLWGSAVVLTGLMFVASSVDSAAAFFGFLPLAVLYAAPVAMAGLGAFLLPVGEAGVPNRSEDAAFRNDGP
jgi:hypothetical protein